MDKPRGQEVIQQRRRKRVIYAIIGIGAIAGITMGLSRLKPAAPSVERSTVWIDTVKRGPMLRQVRGLGTLTPEDIRFIPAITDGRIERVNVLPGAQVNADTILLELSNPTLQQEALDAELKLKSADRGEHTRGQFKTPSLRNVAERTAFLHHGQVASLHAALARYATLAARTRYDARADSLVSSIEISLRDVGDLYAFLQTLTDTSRLETVWEDCGDLPRLR